MTDPISPIHFTALDVAGHDATGTPMTVSGWMLRSFELEERISEPYSLMLALATDDIDLHVPGLVGGRCTFAFGRDEFERQIQGVVVKADTIGTVRGSLRVRLWVGPSFELLGLSRRLRVFQGRTAIEIVAELLDPVFEKYGGTLDTTRLEGWPFRVRDYCVQFEETDLQFALRLLAEEGVVGSFRHESVDAAESMVLMPATACLHSAAGEHEHAPRVTRILSRDPDLADEETIRSFQGSMRMRAAQAEASMWDWKGAAPATVTAYERPFAVDSELPESLSRFGEIFEHEPYRPVEAQDGGPLLEQLATETTLIGHRQRVDDVQATGAGNVLGFTDGATFELCNHPTADLDGQYVVLSVSHHAEFHDSEDGVGQGQSAAYSNRFTCHRIADANDERPYDFVPPRRPKPRAYGPVTAVVVGPDDEEIHTDEHGRIKVRMHWDREGLARGDHETSCWVPVGQLSGGPGYGAVFIPRVGMEVVIAFLSGDPDRPLCTGVVYNGKNQPPYPLPESKTRTVIRTSSSPGGKGFNELSFEDAAGSEEVYLKAQRNLREAVGANHSTSVGADQSLTVGRHRNKTISGSETNVIAEDQSTTIRGISGTQIDGSESTYILCGPQKGNCDQSVTLGYSQLLVEGTRKVWAKNEIILEVGPSGSTLTRVVLTPTGITIEASKSFGITIGDKAKVDILPDLHQISAETVKSIAKGSGMQMHTDVHLEAEDLIRLAQGKGDSCSVKLDGDANVAAGDVTLTAKGTARLSGEDVVIAASKKASLSGKAGVAVDSAANIAVKAGGELSLKGTVVRAN